ncbi:MAG: MBL fold metallo-hydrolase, partial [Trueperella pyogenes]|nr:MBL fold metallo-hydrolase [Trueperella pyogenes]
MRLRIIGCTGSMSGPDSPASCYLLQAHGPDERTGKERTWNLVLDMGPGSFGELWRYIEPANLDAVIFSHCHADHMGDVISLHVYRRWGPGAYCDPMVLA